MHQLTWPNRISIARILLVGPFVVALLHLQEPGWGEWARWSALIVFAAMAISDGLDGFLARRLHQESAVGRFLDPLADKILILCSAILLANEGTHVNDAILSSTAAVIAVGKDVIIVLGFAILYVTTSHAYIHPRPTGKWCTTVQLLGVIAILLSPNLPRNLAWLPSALWWTASALAVITIVQYFQMARVFLAQHEAQAHPPKKDA